MPGGRRAPNADNRGRGRTVGALICVFALVRLICRPTPGRAAPTAAVAPAHPGPDPLGLEIATSLGPASRNALDAALPGLRELTGAVDALADDLSGGLGPPADHGRVATSG